MASSRIAKTPLVQLQRHLAAQAAPAAAAAKKPTDGIEVRTTFILSLALLIEKPSKGPFYSRDEGQKDQPVGSQKFYTMNLSDPPLKVKRPLGQTVDTMVYCKAS